MTTINTLMTITLTIYVVLIAAMAWNVCMTINQPFTGIGGGYLPFAIFSVVPVFFWAIGRYWPRLDTAAE